MSSELGVERPTTLALSDPPGTAAVVVERRVHFTDQERPHPTTPSPKKPRPDPDFRPKRKRSLSFSGPGGGSGGGGGYYRGNKRRKRGRVLPSKFLLGGSITDPLNLGSLSQEETSPGIDSGSVGVSGANTKRWAAVRVIIPPNINDPLNLDASSDNEDFLIQSLRRQRRNRKRKRRLSEPGDSTALNPVVHVEEVDKSRPSITELALSSRTQNNLKLLTVNTELPSPVGPVEGRRESSTGPITPTGTKPAVPGCSGGGGGGPRLGLFKKQRSRIDNKIVSPVIPQPGGERKRHPSHNRHHADRPHLSQQNLKPPASFNPKNEIFQYGNYNKYYGYRNPACTPDPRLQYLRPEWCEGREVLDVGCNIGHMALTIARDYKPKRVVGIDIDKKLINIAGKNIKHYLRIGDPEEAAFPSSMRLLYGPLKTSVRADGTRAFPHNIKFLHANYVLESDELLETVRPEFDLILCLSITKWIHLNWGDAGLKRFFRRCFLNLKPGGRLLLEPQAWPSYNKRRKLTKRIFDNYKSIRLFPDKFNDFLLHEVGFSTSEKMGTPHHTARGFQRPVIIYTKAGGSSKCSPVGESSNKETTKTAAKTTTTTKPPEKCHKMEVTDSAITSANTKPPIAITSANTTPPDTITSANTKPPEKCQEMVLSSATTTDPSEKCQDMEVSCSVVTHKPEQCQEAQVSCTPVSDTTQGTNTSHTNNKNIPSNQSADKDIHSTLNADTNHYSAQSSDKSINSTQSLDKSEGCDAAKNNPSSQNTEVPKLIRSQTDDKDTSNISKVSASTKATSSQSPDTTPHTTNSFDTSEKVPHTTQPPETSKQISHIVQTSETSDKAPYTPQTFEPSPHAASMHSPNKSTQSDVLPRTDRSPHSTARTDTSHDTKESALSLANSPDTSKHTHIATTTSSAHNSGVVDSQILKQDSHVNIDNQGKNTAVVNSEVHKHIVLPGSSVSMHQGTLEEYKPKCKNPVSPVKKVQFVCDNMVTGGSKDTCPSVIHSSNSSREVECPSSPCDDSNKNSSNVKSPESSKPCSKCNRGTSEPWTSGVDERHDTNPIIPRTVSASNCKCHAEGADRVPSKGSDSGGDVNNSCKVTLLSNSQNDSRMPDERLGSLYSKANPGDSKEKSINSPHKAIPVNNKEEKQAGTKSPHKRQHSGEDVEEGEQSTQDSNKKLKLENT